MKKILVILLLLFSFFFSKEIMAGPGSGGYFEMKLVDADSNIWKIRYIAYNDCNDPLGNLTFCVYQYDSAFNLTYINDPSAWTQTTNSYVISPSDTIECYNLPSCKGPCFYQMLTKTVYEFQVDLPDLVIFLNNTISGPEPYYRVQVCSGAGGRPNTDNSNGGQYTNYGVWRAKTYPSAGINQEYLINNTTPQSTSCPQLLACLNTSNTLEFNYVDAEADSIAFDLVPCKNLAGTFMYQGGWTPGNPISGLTNASIDQNTGNITFTPTVVMDGQVCMRIREFRTIINAVGAPERIEVSRTFQDFVVNVVDCGINVLNSDRDTAITIATNDTCVTIFYSDSVVPGYTVLANVTLDSVLLANGATFTQLPPDPANNYGVFCWTPPCNLIGGSYKVTVVVTDDNCPVNNIDTIIYTIQIEDPIQQAVCLDTTIYLDASGNFTIDTSFVDGGSYDSCGIDSIHLTRYMYTCADVGTDTIQLIVTDLEGGTDTCSAVITILDTLPPTPICKDTTIYLNAAGTYTIDSSYINNNSTDNCAISTIILNRYTFGCADIGTNLVTMTVTDIYGNSDTCSANVIVRDTIPPSISCNNATAYLDASGQLIIDTTGLVASFSDNCGVDSSWVSSNDTLLDCSQIGTYNITVFVSDFAGNIDSCISTITVLDTIAPTIVCQPFTAYLDASGQLVVDTSNVISSVGDNCTLDSVWMITADSLLECTDTGFYNITVYAKDASNNIDSCTSLVTVLDTIAPTIVCQPATLYLDASGQLIVDTTGLIVSTGDNCSVDSVWVNVNDTLYGCTDTGNATVTIYVMDGSNNIDSCITTITVLDTIAPTIVCQPATLYLDASGQLIVDTTGLIVSTGDNCSVDSVWVNVNDTLYGCTDTGMATVTIYVMDPSLNIDSCTSIITVLDTIAPTIVCQPATLYLDASGQLIVDTTGLIVSTGDNCSVDSVWVNVNDTLYGCTDTGMATVTIYITDPSGNIDSCISTITVLDTISPTIVCQPVTLYLDAAGQLVVDTTGLIVSTGDNCSVDSVWVNVNDTLYGCTDTGINTATIYIMDPSGNIDSCISTLTILDTIAPTIVCQPATLYLDAAGQLVVDTTGLIVSTGDNCSVDSVWVNVNDTLYGCADTGMATVTIYVMDPSLNIDSCTSIITVLDTIAPTIVCQPATLYLDAAGQLVVDTTGLIVSTGDNCSVDSVWLNVNDTLYGCTDTGMATVTIYITDPSGNIDSCISTITVLDTITPTIVCQPATLYLDAAGQLVVDTTGLIVSTGDNCSVDSVWLNVNDTLYGCTDTGINTATIYVMDPSGNIDSCISTLTILDTIAPTIVCQPATLYLDALGQLIVDTTGLIVSTSDNCSVDSVWVNVNDTLYGCTDTGMATVTIYVMDPSGNMDSCTSVITVLDTITPTIVCQPATLYLDAAGQLVVDTTGLIVSTGDNCSVDSVWVNVNDTLYGCTDTGMATVTIYVMDPSLNIDSCTSIITVLDTITPTIVCQPATLYLDAVGQLVVDTTGLIVSTGDNCSVDSVWVNVNDTLYGCTDTGINTATIYVMDPSGNIDSCISTLTILDTIAPTIVCQPATLYLDASGQLIVDTTGLIVSTGDNCSVDSVWVNVNDTLYGCTDTGMATVTIYITDPSGNMDSCISIITVLDTIAPTIVCQPATLYLDASGQLIVDTTGLIVSTGDNCSVDSVWVNVNDTLYGCTDTGMATVTIYITDPSGNIDSCISTITVLDTISPTIVCQPATLYLDAAGQLVVDTTGLILSTGDNCSVDSVWVNVNDTLYGCTDTGINTATIYVMDPSGNIDSCISTLTILDTIAPTISCLPATIYVDASGQAIIDTTGLVSSTNDNCSVDSVWVNVNDTLFNCSNTGNYNATIYVMDPSGNMDSCISTLTVLDTIAPTIVCQPATLYLDASGQLIVDTTGLIVSTGDNCSVDSVWVNVNDTLFGCADTGTNTVTIYVMDASNNMDSCISTITIFDTINPVVICKDTTVYLDVAGFYTIDSSYIDNGSNDACGIQSITLSRYLFACSDTGVNSVTMYVTDNNGNIDSCTANVTVLDTVGPVAVCIDTTIYLDVTGSYTIDSSYIDGGSNDPCGIFVLSQSTFTCADIGPNNVKLYVYDANNNEDSCTAVVTVLDTTNPVANCNNITIYLDASGQFVIDSSDIDNGSNDACGIATITLSNTTFTCADTGVNSVTMYVTDNNGNIDSCLATVTVIDTIIPVVNAGANDSICGVYTYNLNGNTPSGTLVGTWATINGPSVPVYSNVNDPNANISSLTEGTYELEWSITNGPGCNIVRDTVLIYIYDIPVANAGVDTGLCNQFSLGLYANTPAGLSTGTWTYLTPSPTVPVFTNPNNPTTVVSNLDEGTYTLVWTVTNGNCIDVSDTMLLSVYEIPVATAGADQSQCGRQNTILLGNSPAGTATGMWTNVGGPNTPTILTPSSPVTTVSNLVEGTYTFVWTVSNGVCTPATDTMRLFVYDSVHSNAGMDTNLCATYSLNLYGNQPQGTATGQWYINPATTPPSTPIFADSSLYNTSVAGLVEGTYKFLWILQNGSCPFSVDSITIRVWDNPPSSAGNDSSLCAIYNINMFADSIGGTSVGNWSLDNSYPNPNVPNIVNPSQYNTSVTGLIEGTYSFVWHVTNGPCYDYYDTVLISIYDQPTAIAGPDQFLCDVPSTLINAVPLTGSSVGTWYLLNGNPNVPTFNPNTSSTTVSGLQEAGTYTLFYEAVNGVCPVSRDTITINNYPIPVADFTQSAIEICQEECVQFTNTSSIHPSGAITNYYWVVGGMYSTQTNPEFCFNYAGLMNARLIVESNNGCRDTVLRSDLIKVNNIPVADFNTYLVDDENTSTKIQVQDNSIYSTNYWYSFGDGDTSIIQNPTHIYLDSGFYDITQIVTNDFGCADTLTKTIYVHILLVYVPNTFTPDGNGHNEKFFPVISGDDPDSYLFMIFDRWGELIFQSQNKNEKWDGTYKGVECKTDTYVWKLRTKYKDGDRRFDYIGHVNLLR